MSKLDFRISFSSCITLVALLTVAAGCKPEVSSWTLSADHADLPEGVQRQLVEQLTKNCGTMAAPKLLGNDSVSRQHLLHGQAVYSKYCAQCHGNSGGGDGPAAEFLDPRPRNYQSGIFKFTSTPYGGKPTRDDLVRIVRNGAIGTAMPQFAFLTDDEVQAVVDYVLVLTHRGELESLLIMEALDADEIDPEVVPDYVDQIVERWNSAASEIITPVSPYIPFSEESVKIGEEAFLTETAGCYKCHGKEGRGEIIPNAQVAPGDPPVRSADLTSGMFHGGNRPIDIYRRIFAGINGTPMPAFAQQFQDDPETIWHLVHYVQHISGSRRRQVEDDLSTTFPQESDAKTKPAVESDPADES